MKTIKHISIIILFGLNACNIFKKKDPNPSPQGIVVTVKDKTTGKPISNANVKWVKADKEGSGPTSGDGIYRQEGMDIGDYIVTVSATGYKTDKAGKKMTVPVGKMQSETFELELAPPLEITPSSITFSNGEVSKTVYFKNKNAQSSITLNIEVPQNDQWIKVSPTSITIPANSQKDVVVTVDSKGRGFGSYNSTVILNYSQNGANYNDNLNVYMIIENPQAPSVTTNPPSGITQTSADVMGTVTNIGGSTVTLRGICWSEGTDPNPNTDPKVTTTGGTIGSFTLTANNLKEGKTYYVRAYSINANGIGLGNVEKFTTSVTPTPPSIILNPVANIITTSAVLLGKVSNNGGSNITDQGFCWNTTGNPKITDNKIPTNTDANNNISTNMTGLTQGVVYYVRAYAINSLGVNSVGYSNEINFKTQVPTTPAKVTTLAPTNITETSARLQGNLTELGSSLIKEHGFVWSRQNANPEIENSEKNQIGTKAETGHFITNLNNLKKGTYYYYRAYATSSDGKTYYSNTNYFVTKENNLLTFLTFNNSLEDFSGNNNGVFNESKNIQFSNDRFNIQSNSIEINNNNEGIKFFDKNLGILNQNLTFAFWIKLDLSNFLGSSKQIFGKATGSCTNYDFNNYDAYSLYIDPNLNNKVNFGLATNTLYSPKNFILRRAIFNQEELTEWAFITITFSTNTINIYLNGSIISKIENISFPNVQPYNPLTLGGCGCSSAKQKIDEFRIYTKTFTEQEVEELYKR